MLVPRTQLGKRRVWARGVGPSLTALYALFVIGVCVLGRHQTLAPLEVHTEDVVVGAAEPVEIEARLVDQETGRPCPGVPVHLAHERSASEDLAAATKVTDSEGAIRVVFPPRRRSDDRFRMRLTGSEHHVLATPWRESRSNEAYAVVDVLLVHPGTSFLLVDLTGSYSGTTKGGPQGWKRLPSALLVTERALEEDRILYVFSPRRSSHQRLKFSLRAAGFPRGLLIAAEDPAGLEKLATRLQELEATIGSIVCGDRARDSYRQAFDGVSIHLAQ